MTNLEKKELYLKASAHLKLLANGEIQPVQPLLGICNELDDIQGFDVLHEIGLISEQWNFFSGSTIFPIPSCDDQILEVLSPQRAYECCSRENMWNPEHPYGKLRLDLCQHLSVGFAKLAEEIEI